MGLVSAYLVLTVVLHCSVQHCERMSACMQRSHREGQSALHKAVIILPSAAVTAAYAV